MTPEPPKPLPLPIPTISEIITSQEFLSVQGKENQIAYLQDKVDINHYYYTGLSMQFREVA